MTPVSSAKGPWLQDTIAVSVINSRRFLLEPPNGQVGHAIAVRVLTPKVGQLKLIGLAGAFAEAMCFRCAIPSPMPSWNIDQKSCQPTAWMMW